MSYDLDHELTGGNIPTGSFLHRLLVTDRFKKEVAEHGYINPDEVASPSTTSPRQRWGSLDSKLAVPQDLHSKRERFVSSFAFLSPYTTACRRTPSMLLDLQRVPSLLPSADPDSPHSLHDGLARSHSMRGSMASGGGASRAGSVSLPSFLTGSPSRRSRSRSPQVHASPTDRIKEQLEGLLSPGVVLSPRDGVQCINVNDHPTHSQDTAPGAAAQRMGSSLGSPEVLAVPTIPSTIPSTILGMARSLHSRDRARGAHALSHSPHRRSFETGEEESSAHSRGTSEGGEGSAARTTEGGDCAPEHSNASVTLSAQQARASPPTTALVTSPPSSSKFLLFQAMEEQRSRSGSPALRSRTQSPDLHPVQARASPSATNRPARSSPAQPPQPSSPRGSPRTQLPPLVASVESSTAGVTPDGLPAPDPSRRVARSNTTRPRSPGSPNSQAIISMALAHTHINHRPDLAPRVNPLLAPPKSPPSRLHLTSRPSLPQHPPLDSSNGYLPLLHQSSSHLGSSDAGYAGQHLSALHSSASLPLPQGMSAAPSFTTQSSLLRPPVGTTPRPGVIPQVGTAQGSGPHAAFAAAPSVLGPGSSRHLHSSRSPSPTRLKPASKPSSQALAGGVQEVSLSGMVAGGASLQRGAAGERSMSSPGGHGWRMHDNLRVYAADITPSLLSELSAFHEEDAARKAQAIYAVRTHKVDVGPVLHEKMEVRWLALNKAVEYRKRYVNKEPGLVKAPVMSELIKPAFKQWKAVKYGLSENLPGPNASE